MTYVWLYLIIGFVFGYIESQRIDSTFSVAILTWALWPLYILATIINWIK